MKIIETKSRSNFISWFMYGVGSLLIVLAPIGYTHSYQNYPDDSFEPLVVLILQFIFGIYSLRMILWFIQGKEVISIENGKLIISKTGTFLLKKEREFNLSKIKNIKIEKNQVEENSSWNLAKQFSRQSYIFRIQNTGRIKIILPEFKTHKFLDNVELKKANEIMEKIKTVGNNVYN